MAMVIVILLNVLIAQLSYTYSEAKRNAKLQYAVDRMIIVTRLEHSRFARFVSFRALGPLFYEICPGLNSSMKITKNRKIRKA